MRDPPALLPLRTASCLFFLFSPRRLIWCERSLNITLMLSGHFTSSSTAMGRVAFWSPPPSSVRRPTRPFYRNGLHYGSLSKFDANSLRWWERRDGTASHAGIFSRKLDNAFVRVNGNQGWQEVGTVAVMQSVFVAVARQLSSPAFISIQRPRMKRDMPNQHNLMKLPC